MNSIVYPYSVSIVENIKNSYEKILFSTCDLSHKGLCTDGDKVYAVILEVSQDEDKK